MLLEAQNSRFGEMEGGGQVHVCSCGALTSHPHPPAATGLCPSCGGSGHLGPLPTTSASIAVPTRWDILDLLATRGHRDLVRAVVMGEDTVVSGSYDALIKVCPPFPFLSWAGTHAG